MNEQKTILLVEDNRDDEELTIRALRKHQIAIEVVVARDGAEALDLLLPSGEAIATQLPQVVLLDLNLPKIAGLDVLRQVRADPRTRALPIVVLTSSKEEEDVAQSYALGANAYVRKPVDFQQFSEAVKTLGLFWLHFNELPPSRPRAS
ncbi:MAG: response regulator [Labilithrix sp.]|nr:response regulator [Labilithrix sp.]MCW5815185.1 response regulator [Labilithrix sp.]